MGIDYIEFICLANSRKNRGRCIAGIDTETNRWVRFVNPDGKELTTEDIAFEDNSTPALLDKIGVSIIGAEPLYFQPENFVIDKGYYWNRLDHMSLKSGGKPIRSNIEFLDKVCKINLQNNLMGNTSDKLSSWEATNLGYSLVMIRPEKLAFLKTRNINGSTQIRAHFTYLSSEFDLVVTDDFWEKRFVKENFGLHEVSAKEYWLVISLGERFYKHHYKLVAAVICKK